MKCCKMTTCRVWGFFVFHIRIQAIAYIVKPYVSALPCVLLSNKQTALYIHIAIFGVLHII